MRELPECLGGDVGPKGGVATLGDVVAGDPCASRAVGDVLCG
jgi:hypothetical protein